MSYSFSALLKIWYPVLKVGIVNRYGLNCGFDSLKGKAVFYSAPRPPDAEDEATSSSTVRETDRSGEGG
jgi:hypothetical protein